MEQDVFNVFLMDSRMRTVYSDSRFEFQEYLRDMYVKYGENNIDDNYIIREIYHNLDHIIEINDNYENIINNLENEFKGIERQYNNDEYRRERPFLYNLHHQRSTITNH